MHTSINRKDDGIPDYLMDDIDARYTKKKMNALKVGN